MHHMKTVLLVSADIQDVGADHLKLGILTASKFNLLKLPILLLAWLQN